MHTHTESHRKSRWNIAKLHLKRKKSSLKTQELEITGHTEWRSEAADKGSRAVTGKHESQRRESTLTVHTTPSVGAPGCVLLETQKAGKRDLTQDLKIPTKRCCEDTKKLRIHTERWIKNKNRAQETGIPH